MSRRVGSSGAALWGVLATATSPRFALVTAGLLLLATPLLLRALTSPTNIEDPSRVAI